MDSRVPRLDEPTKGVSAASVKDNDAVHLGESYFYVNADDSRLYVNADDSRLYVNAEVVANDNVPPSAAAQNLPSSTGPSPDKPGLVDQAGELQMRSELHQVPLSAKTSGKESHKVSRMSTADRRSQYIVATEKAAKPEKPTVTQKPGRVVVPTGLEETIAINLTRKPTMQTVIEEGTSDIGIDREAIKPSVTSIDKKPSRSMEASEDTKCMLAL